MDTAQLLLLQLRLTYIAEIPYRADELETLVLEIERNGQTGERYNDLYRRIHSLKGSGGTYGAQIVTAICHSFEDYLASATDKAGMHNAIASNIALAFIDLLRLAGNGLKNRREEFVDIEGQLIDLRQRAFTPQFSAMVVESPGTLVNLIGQVLKGHGCRMVLVDDAYLALGRALAEPLDLLITALEMRGLNGSALIAALKLTDGPNKRMHCILLTANETLIVSQPEPDFRLLKNAEMLTSLDQLVGQIFKIS
jgi:CheY-like chemotaxis protein